MDFQVGDIVTILCEEGSEFCGKQARVVQIKKDGHKDGPIGVNFPKWYGLLEKQFFDSTFTPDTVVRYKTGELRKDDCWKQPTNDCSVMARLLFGDEMWHSIFAPDEPFIPNDSICMHKGCNEKATLVIYVNLWGVVYIIYVCPSHTEGHGLCGETWPFKED